MVRMQRMVGLATAATALVCGCGNPNAPSGSMEKAKVSGMVRRDGKPLSGGTISFSAANAERRMVPASKAPIGEDGTYAVETLVGSNRVNVFPPVGDLKKLSQAERLKRGRPSSVGPGAFQARFRVESGTNEYNIDM